MSASIQQERASSSPPGARPAPDLHQRILAWLPQRRGRAVPIASLARLVRAAHREVEQALQDMADSGLYPICASSRPPMGVWLGSRTDVREYLERHDARIRSMLRRRHGLRRWLATPEPRPVQEELWQVAS